MYLFSPFYLFFTQNGFDQKSFLEGDSEKGSRFGSAIANIGDINNDGFNGEPKVLPMSFLIIFVSLICFQGTKNVVRVLGDFWVIGFRVMENPLFKQNVPLYVTLC